MPSIAQLQAMRVESQKQLNHHKKIAVEKINQTCEQIFNKGNELKGIVDNLNDKVKSLTPFVLDNTRLDDVGPKITIGSWRSDVYGVNAFINDNTFEILERKNLDVPDIDEKVILSGLVTNRGESIELTLIHGQEPDPRRSMDLLKQPKVLELYLQNLGSKVVKANEFDRKIDEIKRKREEIIPIVSRKAQDLSNVAMIYNNKADQLSQTLDQINDSDIKIENSQNKKVGVSEWKKSANDGIQRFDIEGRDARDVEGATAQLTLSGIMIGKNPIEESLVEIVETDNTDAKKAAVIIRNDGQEIENKIAEIKQILETMEKNILIAEKVLEMQKSGDSEERIEALNKFNNRLAQLNNFHKGYLTRYNDIVSLVEIITENEITPNDDNKRLIEEAKIDNQDNIRIGQIGNLASISVDNYQGLNNQELVDALGNINSFILADAAARDTVATSLISTVNKEYANTGLIEGLIEEYKRDLNESSLIEDIREKVGFIAEQVSGVVTMAGGLKLAELVKKLNDLPRVRATEE
jgi:hypothetical protein